MMNKQKIQLYWIVLCTLLCSNCKTPQLTQKVENRVVPEYKSSSTDTTNIATIDWKRYFGDEDLAKLIDTALSRNQELSITLQEIEIAKSEVRIKKGELLPTVMLRAGAGVEKVGRYTSQGAGDANTEIDHGKKIPDPLPDYMLGLYANWEIDVWHKLRDAKQSAYLSYLATVEGKNFVVTSLVAEIANSYYELLALDAQLDIVHQNIALQNNALEVVRVQKEAARVTELAVRKFEAEVFKSKSLAFDIKQEIVQVENKINFLLGRFPQPIVRNGKNFEAVVPAHIQTGLSSQLLVNRPDIKQAELNLLASKLDVKVARAQFLPSFGLSAAVGLQAFNPSYFVKMPESILFNLIGEMAAPLINKNAIKANYAAANARQIQAVFEYEKVILTGYLEVANQLSAIDNLQQSYSLKSNQSLLLNQSIELVNDLFRSARADYLEVLMTQRDALETKLELIETKKQQLGATVKIYQALGGGWK